MDSGLRKIPGSLAWTVRDYKLLHRANIRLGTWHERLVVWAFQKYVEKTGTRFAIAPPPKSKDKV